jgi:lipoprotein-anchoring transpeptidase ErfK/SrfK
MRAIARPSARRVRCRGGLRAATALAVAVAALPAPAGAAQRVTNLYHPGVSTVWAYVNVPVTARARPSMQAHSAGRLRTHTPDHTDELVMVLAGTRVRGRPWVKVSLPVLPAGATGWVPQSVLGELHTASTWVKVDRARTRLTVVRDGRTVFSARVGVGRPGSPTPPGRFYVRDRLVPADPAGLYGPVALGLSARSEVLTDWPGGGVVGIHGTNEPGLLPGHVSHGCIRMRNADILHLDRIVEVGAPVTIR